MRKLLTIFIFTSSLFGETQEELLLLFFEDPTDISVNLKLAKESTKNGDFDTAIATYERLIIFQDEVPEHYLNLAELYNSLEMYTQAEMTIDEAISAGHGKDSRVIKIQKQLDSRKKHSFWSGSLSYSYGYDSNPLLAPKVSDIELFFQDERMILLEGEKITSLIDNSNFANYTLSLSSLYDIGLLGSFYWRNGLFFNRKEFDKFDELQSDYTQYSSILGNKIDEKSELSLGFEFANAKYSNKNLFDSYGLSTIYRQTLESEFTLSLGLKYQLYNYTEMEKRDSGTLSIVVSKPLRDIESIQFGGRVTQSGLSFSGENRFDKYLEQKLFAKYRVDEKSIFLAVSGEIDIVNHIDNISENQTEEREDFKRSLDISGGYKWRYGKLSIGYRFEKNSSNLKYVNSQKEEIYTKMELFIQSH